MCSTAERIILDISVGRPVELAAKSWNITVAVPLVDISRPTMTRLSRRLEGMFGPARADDLLLQVDSRKKTAEGALEACRRAVDHIADDHQRHPADSWQVKLLKLSWGLRVRTVPYDIIGSTKRAISRAFELKGMTPEQLGARVDWSGGRDRVALQWYSLMSDAFEMRTRYVLHIDEDTNLVPLAPDARSRAAGALAAFATHATQELRARPRLLYVLAHQCREPAICRKSCAFHERSFRISKDRTIQHADKLVGYSTAASPAKAKAYDGYLRVMQDGRGRSPAEFEGVIFDAQRFREAMLATPLVEQRILNKQPGIEPAFIDWFERQWFADGTANYNGEWAYVPSSTSDPSHDVCVTTDSWLKKYNVPGGADAVDNQRSSLARPEPRNNTTQPSWRSSAACCDPGSSSSRDAQMAHRLHLVLGLPYSES